MDDAAGYREPYSRRNLSAFIGNCDKIFKSHGIVDCRPCNFHADSPGDAGSFPRSQVILQITIDQLRGDGPGRCHDRLGEGGFRYLMEKGAWYVNARYQHANTEIAVGHETLATGADPSRHGIVANDWIDQKTGAFVYNTEDKRHHIIGREAKAHEGVSPCNPLATSISNDLVVHTYYYDDYPAWAKHWNAAKPADAFKAKSWELFYDRSTYVHGQMDNRPYEADLKTLGRTFLNSLAGDTKYFSLLLIPDQSIFSSILPLKKINSIARIG